jgi:hypothetical protein
MRTKKAICTILILGFSISVFFGYLVLRTISLRDSKIVVAKPYGGIRLSSNQVLNAEYRAETGSIADDMSLANDHYFVHNDVTNAIKYFEWAASRGSKPAAFNLGQIYSGDPRVLDLKQAQYWYTIAQKLGDKEASEKLQEINSN